MHIPKLIEFALHTAADIVAEHGVAILTTPIPRPLYLRCTMAFAMKYGTKYTDMRIYLIARKGSLQLQRNTEFTITTIITSLDHVDIASSVNDLRTLIKTLIKLSDDDVDGVASCIQRFVTRCTSVLKHRAIVILMSTALEQSPCKSIRQLLVSYGAELNRNHVSFFIKACACGVHDAGSVKRAIDNGYTVKQSDLVLAISSGDRCTIDSVATALGDDGVVRSGTALSARDFDARTCDYLVEFDILKCGDRYIFNDIRTY